MSAQDLIAALADERSLVRLHALHGLSNARLSPDERSSLEARLPDLLLDRHPRVRLEALHRVRTSLVSELAQELVDCIDYYYTPVSVAATHVLADRDPPTYADVFLDALGHRNRRRTRLRAELAVALGRTKDPRAFDALAHLAQTATNREVTVATATAFGHLGDPRAAPLLQGMLMDPGLQVQLMRSVRHANPVRTAAARALRILRRLEH